MLFGDAWASGGGESPAVRDPGSSIPKGRTVTPDPPKAGYLHHLSLRRRREQSGWA